MVFVHTLIFIFILLYKIAYFRVGYMLVDVHQPNLCQSQIFRVLIIGHKGVGHWLIEQITIDPIWN